jgi:hypothetical protein
MDKDILKQLMQDEAGTLVAQIVTDDAPSSEGSDGIRYLSG